MGSIYFALGNEMRYPRYYQTLVPIETRLYSVKCSFPLIILMFPWLYESVIMAYNALYSMIYELWKTGDAYQHFSLELYTNA